MRKPNMGLDFTPPNMDYVIPRLRNPKIGYDFTALRVSVKLASFYQ